MSSPLATTAYLQPLEELIRGTRAGEATALAVIYHRYASALFRTAYRLSRSAADAEDIVHDVFVGLPEALRRYEERGNFEAWLTRITVRVALMRARTGRRRHEASLQDAADVIGRDRSDARVEQAELWRAVSDLPTGLLTVFVLKQVEGFSHDEIGSLLGISAEASRVRLARALGMLRRALG